LFSGCLVDPQMPQDIATTLPVPVRPLNDSLTAPIDTVSHRHPIDTRPRPSGNGAIERPSKPSLPERPDLPQPRAGDVQLGLLSDMTSLGSLYASADNWWNLEVDNAPIDPESDRLIATIESLEGTRGRMHPDFTPHYGIPYCVVGDETPRVDVEFRNANESDQADPDGLAGYPFRPRPSPTTDTSRTAA
jgi:hypothetical protein